jgi:hypothetical protein
MIGECAHSPAALRHHVFQFLLIMITINFQFPNGVFVIGGLFGALVGFNIVGNGRSGECHNILCAVRFSSVLLHLDPVTYLHLHLWAREAQLQAFPFGRLFHFIKSLERAVCFANIVSSIAKSL